MFTNLLVPLDGTTDSAIALPPARTVARVTGARLTLLRVVPSGGASEDRSATLKAQSYLARIATELGPSGVVVQTAVRHGASVAEEIVRAAGADPIVMATHGRGGLHRAVLGSVADGVLAKSSGPALLLRPGGVRMDKLATILVPMDGTPGASLALSAAVPLAKAAEARIVLVQVILPGTRFYVQDGQPIIVDSDDDARAGAQSYLGDTARRLERAGVEARAYAGRGRPWDEIIETADSMSADLIVMSTHALTGPARTLLGSVADEVVRNAHQPVLLVRQRHGALAPTSAEPRAAFVV